MTTYILMRNNKQSVPLTLAELLQIGFKPYDLIWIEGKSAMWRYPSEIAELKDFAEAVEEQPYDRFCSKKKTDEKSTAPQNSSFKKQVFVSLPDKSNNEFITTSTQAHKTATPAEIFHEPAPAAEIKFSQPLDDIKEFYVNNLKEKKRKTAHQLIILQSIKRIASYMGLIAIGILSGYFFFFSKSNKNPSIADNKLIPIESVIPALNQPKENIESHEISNELNSVNEDSKQSFLPDEELTKTEKNIIKEKQAANQSSTNLQIKGKEHPQINIINTEQVAPGVEINNKTGERNKTIRNENDETIQSPINPVNELSKLVIVKSNDYQRGAFGGIRNLELTLTNQSKYFLDKVVVELQYVKPSEQPLRSENITFRSIPPDGVLTIAVPPSNRGIKVAFKISKIESKELTNEMAGL